jgi:hypothetical protein
MGDLKDPRLMYLKAWLFLAIGLLAAAGVLAEAPSVRAGVRAGLLLAACVWAFCRLYYFLFYVIERYIDREFRFAGVWSAVVYLARRGGRKRPS